MNIIQHLRRKTGITQQELAAMAGTSQSTIAAYERGSKSPTLRTIDNLARSQGLEVVVNYLPRMTREDRRSLAFHQAIADIIIKSPESSICRAKHNLQKLLQMHPGAMQLLEKWQIWLDLPVDSLLVNILDPAPEAREMRQVSPFSGLLSANDRLRIVKQFRKDYTP